MRNKIKPWWNKQDKYSKRYLIFFGLMIILSLLPIFVSHASTYGSNFLTGGTCTAKANTCANAFDGNQATYWYDLNPPSWIKYDLGSDISKKLVKLHILPWTNDGAGSGLKHFVLQGSNDDSTWIDLINATNTNSTANPDIYVDFYTSTTTEPTAYRYFKLNVDPSYRSPYAEPNLIEIQAMECTDCWVSTSTATSTTLTGNEMINEYLMLFLDIIFIGGIIAGLIWIQSKF